MLKHRRTIHYTTFILGLCFFVYGILSAVIFNSSRFYTIFALGAYLVLDFIDYKITKTSVMTFFLGRHHWYAFPIFLVLSTVACFLVDYVLGVKTAKMWEWNNYKAFDYALMYLFMNASYVLGMYEIYRVIRHFLKKGVNEKHLLSFYLHKRVVNIGAYILMLIGAAGLISPFFISIYNLNLPIQPAMLSSFIGLALITDIVTYFLGGRPIISEVIKLNLLTTFSVFFTILIASIGTEILNLFGREWKYLNMPFPNLTVINIPLAVFVGWVPLVVSTICIVNLVKHVVYLYDKK